MNTELVFSHGTFTGHKIRVTEDGYASIYDVMKVAGVGRDPSTAWNELKPKFFALAPSDTVKIIKFKGRGQRDTPTINGPGLVRLLFLLPGQRARAFVSESAETLIRFISGDETLVEEIRRNREIVLNYPDSANAFMAKLLYNPLFSAPIIKPIKGYVYIIQVNYLPSRVKIGHTRRSIQDLRERYRTSFPDKTRIYAMESEDSFATEQETHEFFSDKREAGEWFKSEFLEHYLDYITNVSHK